MFALFRPILRLVFVLASTLLYCVSSDVVIASFIDSTSPSVTVSSLRMLDESLNIIACVNSTSPTSVITYLESSSVEVLHLQSIGGQNVAVNPYFDCLASVLTQQAIISDDSTTAPTVVLVPHNVEFDREFLDEIVFSIENAGEKLHVACIAPKTKTKASKSKKGKQIKLKWGGSGAGACYGKEGAASVPLLAVSSRNHYGISLQNLIQNLYEQRLFSSTTSVSIPNTDASDAGRDGMGSKFASASTILDAFMLNYIAILDANAQVATFPYHTKSWFKATSSSARKSSKRAERVGDTARGRRRAAGVNMNHLNAQLPVPGSDMGVVPPPPSTVYDIFPYFDEFTLARVRMESLQGVVHRFVVLESACTHTGLPKHQDSFFLDHAHSLAPTVLRKVVHVLMDLPYAPAASHEEVWHNERYQRNFLARLLDGDLGGAVVSTWDCDGAISRSEVDFDGIGVPAESSLCMLNTRDGGSDVVFSIKNDDLVVIADADELPKASALFRAAHLLGGGSGHGYPYRFPGVARLSMAHYLYNLTTPMGNFLSRHPYIARAGYLRDTYRSDREQWMSFASSIRVGDLEPACTDRPDCRVNVLSQGGWHLSNFKAVKRIRYKLNSVAHQEFNSAIVRRALSARIAEGLPAEFGFDTNSKAHAAGNVFLRQQRRPLYDFELKDFEYKQLVSLWNRYATEGDIAVGSDAEVTVTETTHHDDGSPSSSSDNDTVNTKKLSFSERLKMKKQNLNSRAKDRS